MKLLSHREKTNLEVEIDEVLDKLSTFEPSGEDYRKIVENLKVLYQIKNISLERKIKPETILAISANILGIAMIIGYEKANVITTKAISFIAKGRV